MLRALGVAYGAPPPPVSRDPFHLVLWEQVAYLVPDDRRLVAFEGLREATGLAPEAILSTPAARLKAIARKGGSIAASERAARMRRSAEIVMRRWDGDLGAALRLPLPQARRALAAFPMIGEPGADKILAFTGAARVLPLDSNGLRVVQRLGLAAEGKDYRASYRSAQTALASARPRGREALVRAFFLLREHGRVLCRRRAPECGACPLRTRCPSAAPRPRASR